MTKGERLYGSYKTIETKLRKVKRGSYRGWEVVKVSPRIVLVIGERTVYNGLVTYEEYSGSYFEQSANIRALLVCEKWNLNPYYTTDY